MSAIETIRRKAAKYPFARVEEGADWISVRPPGASAITVRLREGKGDYTVYFEGWHEEIEQEGEALELFARGLSSSARLKVTSRGGFDHRWAAEFWEDERWQEGSITGLFFFPFWRAKEVRYLQNDLIKEAVPNERAG